MYQYITKGYVPSQIKEGDVRILKATCEDCLVIDDVLFRLNIPKDKK